MAAGGIHVSTDLAVYLLIFAGLFILFSRLPRPKLKQLRYKGLELDFDSEANADKLPAPDKTDEGG